MESIKGAIAILQGLATDTCLVLWGKNSLLC